MEMAATSRRTDAAVIERLFADGSRFDFFQVVVLLERWGRERAEPQTERHDKQRGAVGSDRLPDEEIARFAALPSLVFPGSDVAGVEPSSEGLAAGAARVTVSFMGLTGPAGALPDHYTVQLIERCHTKHKDFALRDFLDLLNHRAISFYFRAWEKYRFPYAFERARRDVTEPSDDLFSFLLRCLVGHGTPGLQRRLPVDDDVPVYYGGHFAHFPRNGVSLEILLADYFGVPVLIRQFCGRWLYLSRDQQSRMPGAACLDGVNCLLGVNVVVGTQMWSVDGKFRIRLGPLTFSQYCDFLPVGRSLKKVWEVVRLYVGPELDFDVQPVLLAAEVPACRPSAEDATGPMLGWTTWLRSESTAADAADAILQLDPC